MRKYLADAASGAEMGQGCGVWCCILAQIGIMAQRAAIQTKAEGNVLSEKPHQTPGLDQAIRSPRFPLVFRSLI